MEILLAAGAAQGLLLCAALARIPAPAPRLLAAIVGCLALILGEEFLDVAGLQRHFPHTAALTINFELLLGPLALLYARALMQAPNPKLRSALHFLPFVLSTVFLLPYYLKAGDEKLILLRQDPDGLILRLVWFKAVHLFAYLLWTLGYLWRGVPKSSEGSYASAIVTWYRRAIATAFCLGALSFSFFLLGHAGFDLPLDSDRLSGLLLTAWIYGIGFASINASRWHRAEEVDEAPTEKPPKYSTSPLSDTERKRLRQNLVAYLEGEEPYRDGELRLGSLAAQLKVPAHHLSEVLNSEMGTGFSELINRYRVEAAKASLALPENRDRTILDVAFESGFNSKASFNRTFKLQTGLTPSEYRRRLAQTGE